MNPSIYIAVVVAVMLFVVLLAWALCRAAAENDLGAEFNAFGSEGAQVCSVRGCAAPAIYGSPYCDKHDFAAACETAAYREAMHAERVTVADLPPSVVFRGLIASPRVPGGADQIAGTGRAA